MRGRICGVLEMMTEFPQQCCGFLKHLLLAQRKILFVLNFLHRRHKAGIANGQQTVQWTFAVSGALWRSSRCLL